MDEMDLPTATYAWCFSHGRLQTFWSDREPWCTAIWVRLIAASTEGEALAEKQACYGEARFLHELPLGTQVELHGAG